MIDADVLVDSFKKSYSTLSEIYKTESDADAEITEAQLIVLCEVILRTKNAPTIEAVPVEQAESIRKEAVEDFAKWCYINGIDFSYMHKATDAEPFCKRVLKRYEEEQGKKV